MILLTRTKSLELWAWGTVATWAVRGQETLDPDVVRFLLCGSPSQEQMLCSTAIWSQTSFQPAESQSMYH